MIKGGDMTGYNDAVFISSKHKGKENYFFTVRGLSDV
jgi:hypothetical protein